MNKTNQAISKTKIRTVLEDTTLYNTQNNPWSETLKEKDKLAVPNTAGGDPQLKH